MRRTLAAVLSLVAMVASLAAVGGWWFRSAAFDEAAFDEAATAAVRTEQARELIGDELELEIRRAVGDDAIDLIAGFIDVDAILDSIVARAVASEAFQAAYREAATDIHRRLLGRSNADLVIPSATTSQIVREQAAEINPLLGDLLAGIEVAPLEVSLADVPDLTPSLNLARVIGLGGLLVAAITAVAAYALHPEPNRILRRFGGWLAFLGCIAGAIAWLGPRAAGALVDPELPVPVLEGAFTAVRGRFYATAIALIAGGIVLFVSALSTTRRVASPAPPEEDHLRPV